MNEKRVTLLLGACGNDYVSKEGQWLMLCVHGLRNHVALPRNTPQRIDLVFTKRRTANSFALTQIESAKAFVFNIRLRALPKVCTYFSFKSLLHEAWEAGYRYVRVEYDG